MRAYILSIGSELILGHLTDTNATFLAQDLAAHGIELVHVTHVGDERERLVATLRHALGIADVVICTGGIGPTDDDMTREAIADVCGESPEIDGTLLQEVQAFFLHRGLPMPERNAKQAWLIPSADVLPNPVGTAPGWFVRPVASQHQAIIAMPGVPREMFRMWREQALPRILPMAGANVIDTITLKSIGIGESAAEHAIHDLVAAEHPVVATYAKDDGVHVRITAIGKDGTEVRRVRDQAEQEVRDRLRDFIWGQGEETLAGVIVRGLKALDVRLSLVEVGTGGSLTALVSSSFDASGAIVGSTVRPILQSCTDTPEALAIRAAGNQIDRIAIAVVLDAQDAGEGRVDGKVHVAIAGGGKPAEVASALTIRAGIADAQRRAALHASDVLRQYLNANRP